MIVGRGYAHISSTSHDEVADVRRRWSVSIPPELDEEVRREVGPPPEETISSFVELACRREIERRRRDHSAREKPRARSSLSR